MKNSATNRVYYGEYSLAHWIELMLSGNIELPKYQRHFVWKKRDVRRLIQSLCDGQFVQPVTIALYNDGNEKHNIILDGQQRLTSLLLAYLGYFPDKEKFKNISEPRMAGEDDSAADESTAGDSRESMSILWRYPELLRLGSDKNDIVRGLSKDERYEELDEPLFTGLNDDFFKRHFLGFSYVVPQSASVADVQRCFSQLFRNINYFGKKLDAMESRKSLYYQNESITAFFEGECSDGSDVLDGLMITEDLQLCKIDFVRYLSILSQYFASRRPDDAKDVMVGYSAYSSREGYYADYVSYVLGMEQEERHNKFDGFDFMSVFPNDVWRQRFDSLKSVIRELKSEMPLNDKGAFSTVYEADYWLFGLIYRIVFLRKDVVWTNLSDEEMTVRIKRLRAKLKAAIDKNRQNVIFIKNANRLGFIRNRLVESCKIFQPYVP